MKVLGLLSLLVSLSAFSFSGHDQFKVQMVKPWGEFGFRALGRGNSFTEMRFDCSKASEMGLVLTVVNSYGKSNHVVLPAGSLGADKYKCKENLKNYFAGVYSKRRLASLKNDSKDIRTVELNIIRGGFFSNIENRKTLSFR